MPIKLRVFLKYLETPTPTVILDWFLTLKSRTWNQTKSHVIETLEFHLAGKFEKFNMKSEIRNILLV